MSWESLLSDTRHEELRNILKNVCDDNQGTVFRKLVKEDLFDAMDLASLSKIQLKELKLSTGHYNELKPFVKYCRVNKKFPDLSAKWHELNDISTSNSEAGCEGPEEKPTNMSSVDDDGAITFREKKVDKLPTWSGDPLDWDAYLPKQGAF